MNTKRYYQFYILALLLLPIIGHSQQQDGLTWIKTFASKGFNTSPGFVTDTAGFVYLPIVFVDSVHFESSGKTDTLVSAGDGDILLAKIEALTGNIQQYRHLSSKAHLVATDISMIDGHLLLSGSCRDSVFMIADTNNPQYIGGKTGQEKCFLLEMTTDGNLINFIMPADEAYQSGLNMVRTNGHSIMAYGTVRPDTLSPLANLFIIQNESESSQTIIDSLSRADIHDGIFFKQGVWVCGSFTDSLVMNNAMLYGLAGKQAFMARVDTGDYPFSNAIAWPGYQDAEATGMAFYNHKLWVGINFSDSINSGNGSQILSHGMSDAAILQYDTTLQLQHIYQFGGSYSERIDRLFVSNNTLYVLGNTASPDTKLWINGLDKLTITQVENTGIQTLLSIDTRDSVKLEWTAQEGRLGKMTGVNKVNASETMIAGVFNQPMIIDTTEYTPAGIQDVFILRVADVCLNRLKQSDIKLMFCKGDSIQLIGAQLIGKSEIRTDPEAGNIFIKQAGKYSVRSKNDCECEIADTLLFEVIEARDALKKGFKSSELKFQTFILSDKSELKVSYCGECIESEKQPLFKIHPNPSTSSSTLDMFLPKAGTMQVRIVNAEGALVKYMEYQKTEGNHRIDLQSDILKPGTYLVHINHNDGVSNISTLLVLIKL